GQPSGRLVEKASFSAARAARRPSPPPTATAQRGLCLQFGKSQRFTTKSRRTRRKEPRRRAFSFRAPRSPGLCLLPIALFFALLRVLRDFVVDLLILIARGSSQDGVDMNNEITGGIRTLLRLEGLALLVAATVMYGRSGFGWSTFALFFLAP